MTIFVTTGTVTMSGTLSPDINTVQLTHDKHFTPICIMHILAHNLFHILIFFMLLQSAYSLSNMFNNQHIDIALITEHKPLPRSQHFLCSINNNFYAYNTCDSSSNNYAISGCGKAGTAILFRKSLQNYVSLVNTIS